MKLTLKKLLGHKFGNRFTWGEFYWGGRDLSLQYTGGDVFDHDLLIISIPFLFKAYIHVSDERERVCDLGWGYGFYVYHWEEDVVLQWGKHRYRVEFPWMLKWLSTEILDFDRNVLHITTKKDKNIYDKNGKFDESNRVKQQIESQSYEYKYTLKSGIVQNRIATIRCIERRTWGWKWFPWKKFIRTDIDVTFDGEVGEKSGSWKGGCVGCSYDILPNETPEQCLRRMERERKF